MDGILRTTLKQYMTMRGSSYCIGPRFANAEKDFALTKADTHFGHYSIIGTVSDIKLCLARPWPTFNTVLSKRVLRSIARKPCTGSVWYCKPEQERLAPWVTSSKDGSVCLQSFSPRHTNMADFTHLWRLYGSWLREVVVVLSGIKLS